MTIELELARIEWDDNGHPRSEQFGDVYFSSLGGMEETQHVFLNGNRLQQRWSSVKRSGDRYPSFIIGETGFGTGLNFLATWELWNRCKPPGAHLHFFSSELYPLAKQDLRRALQLFPRLADLANRLIELYPSPVPGYHRLQIARDVTLDLLLGDGVEMFRQLRPTEHPSFVRDNRWKVDAWYLDGFAPSANPLMWQESLFELIGSLSTEGTTLATFSAAGQVRRGLQKIGFDVTKEPGFGHKREMVVAQYINTSASPSDNTGGQSDIPHRANKSWATWHLFAPPKQSEPDDCVIIGSGISGVLTAKAMKDRGWNVTIFDSRKGLTDQASGNPQAALFTKLSPQPGTLSDFIEIALGYAQRYYRDYWNASNEHGFGAQCGLVHLIKHEATARAIAERYRQAPEFAQFKLAKELSELAGIPLSKSGLWFPNSGWISPDRLIGSLLQENDIPLNLTDAPVAVERDGDIWMVRDDLGNLLAESAVVVLAAGQAVTQMQPTAWLPVRPIRGQISYLPHTPGTAPKTVLCESSYITPAQGGFHCIGATYELDSDHTDLTEQDHRENLAAAAELLNANLDNYDPASLTGRASVRASTPDYLPLAGPVADREIFVREFQFLSTDATLVSHHRGAVQEGLFVIGGMGSRGFCYAPICAEHLAALICGDPSPLPQDVARSIHPSRFLVRNLIRSNRNR